MIEIVVPAVIMRRCEIEASRHSPLETGGLFMGRVDQDGRRCVEHLVGAGPGARRTRRWLEVDHDYQNVEIARVVRSFPYLVYIGEWHSHPTARDATPSWTDRRALAKLGSFAPLRCAEPLMIILHPRGEHWNAGAWRISSKDNLRFAPPGVTSVEIVVNIPI